MTKINYVITDKQISFYKDKEVRTVYADSGLNYVIYTSLRNSLINNEPIVATTPKEAINVIKRNPAIVPSVNKRIKELEEANLPTDPFLKFLSNCNDNLLVEGLKLLSKAGTTDMPLTWDGNIILYQRANMLNRSWAPTTFNFGEVMEREEGFNVSSFHNIVDGTCPDSGPVFEVMVKPQDIISLDNRVHSLWKVKRLTQMSRLSLRPSQKEKAEAGIVEFITNCVGDGKQAIRLPYNAGTAAKMVTAMFQNNNQSVNNIVPVQATLAYC